MRINLCLADEARGGKQQGEGNRPTRGLSEYDGPERNGALHKRV